MSQLPLLQYQHGFSVLILQAHLLAIIKKITNYVQVLKSAFQKKLSRIKIRIKISQEKVRILPDLNYL